MVITPPVLPVIAPGGANKNAAGTVHFETLLDRNPLGAWRQVAGRCPPRCELRDKKRQWDAWSRVSLLGEFFYAASLRWDKIQRKVTSHVCRRLHHLHRARIRRCCARTRWRATIRHWAPNGRCYD